MSTSGASGKTSLACLPKASSQARKKIRCGIKHIATHVVNGPKVVHLENVTVCGIIVMKSPNSSSTRHWMADSLLPPHLQPGMHQ